MRRRASIRAVLAAVVVAAATRDLASAAAPCVGDCPPLDDRVTVDELVTGVTIALGGSALDACPSYDVNGNDAVGVDELVTAVNNAQQGCPGGPTPLSSATPTSTLPVSTPTPTVTSTPAVGPTVGYFGVASADDLVQPPTATDPSGIPIYQRSFGSGFLLVVEAQPGTLLRDVGGNTFSSDGLPDLQIQSTRNLGNGSAAVCDDQAPNFGGVPGIDPPRLDDPAAIADPLNDFGCRFIDGAGATVGRTCALSCVRFPDADFRCVNEHTQEQFCALIDMPLQFPSGDTLVTARVRDVLGNLGAPAQLILRVAP